MAEGQPNMILVPQQNNLPYVEEKDLSPDASGGIRCQIMVPGIQNSDGAVENSLVRIDIKGQLDGRVFDYRRNFKYNLGDGCLVNIPRGVEQALHHFCIHEKSLVTLKSEFAFGKNGDKTFSIPPNATVVYEVTLKSVDLPLQKESLSLKEKYVCAKVLKEKGSSFFQKGEYEGACRKFLQAVDYLSDIELSKEKEDYYDFLELCYLNLALCSLKTNNPSDTITWGQKVLKMLELRREDELDMERKAKALYRIGLAYLAKQEPHIAKDYFQKVLAVDSDNQAAAKQLLQCEQLEKKVTAMEKQLCLKMFSSSR